MKTRFRLAEYHSGAVVPSLEPVRSNSLRSANAMAPRIIDVSSLYVRLEKSRILVAFFAAIEHLKNQLHADTEQISSECR